MTPIRFLLFFIWQWLSSTVPCCSGSVVLTPSNGPTAPPPPLPTPSVSLSMVEVEERPQEPAQPDQAQEPPAKRFKVDLAALGH